MAEEKSNMARHLRSRRTTAARSKLPFRFLLLVAAPLAALCFATVADAQALRGIVDDVRNADFINDYFGSDIAPGVSEKDREKAAK